MLKPQLIDKPAFTVVGLEAPFIHALSPDATNLKVIGALWEQFTHRACEVQNRLGEERYGIIDARGEAERSHPDELTYLAAVTVSELGDLPDGMVSRTVPAATCAVFTHRGPINRIGKTCEEIYRTWLPRSGYQHAHAPDVELYDRRFHPDRDDSEMEYWVPVMKA